MARPTIKSLQDRIASIQAHRAAQVQSLGGEVRRLNNGGFERDARESWDTVDFAGTTVGAGGATDNAINTAKSWWGTLTNDLGRHRGEVNHLAALRDRPIETIMDRPLGGVVRSMYENVAGTNHPKQALYAERASAAALSSVVGIPALMAAYDGLFGESQSIGTLPVTVAAERPSTGY
jgi:hypothetical protein